MSQPLKKFKKTHNTLFTIQDNHMQQALGEMWTDFKNKTLINDIYFISELDGRIIAANQAVLLAMTDFIKAMFLNSLNETEAKEMFLANIPIDIIATIIQYLYTKRIHINENNAQRLLSHAAMKLFPEVVEACADFLIPCINTGNCLSIIKYAKLHSCQDLLKIAFRHLKTYFTNVVVGDEYLNCSLDEVFEYLAIDDICVEDEKIVFDAMIRWIDHDPVSRNIHFPKLLTTVRLYYIEKNYLLEQVLKNRNKEYLSSLLEGIDQNLSNAKLMLMPRRSGLKSNSLVFVSNKNAKVYNLIEKRFEIERNFKTTGDFLAVRFGSEVFIIDSNFFQSVDLTTGESNSYETPVSLGDTESLTVLNNNIYAIYGEVVEKFNFNSVEWDYVACMRQSRENHCTAVLNKKLYVIGGISYEDGCLNSVECYDPVIDEWNFCRPMIKKRFFAQAVAWNGYIFVFGGRGSDNEVLKCIEKYNPRTCSWSLVSEMSSKRTNMGTYLHNDKIILYGGDNGKRPLKFMEEFDPFTHECKRVKENNFPFLTGKKKIYAFSYNLRKYDYYH